MSLYNIVFGANPAGAFGLVVVGIPPNEIGRLRDAWIAKEGDDFVIVIYTRMGGGNREAYETEINRLRSSPLYLRDADDDFDSTYASFFFRVPEEMAGEVAKAYAAQPDHYTQLTVGERWEQAISSIQTGTKP